jgi:hypothetical protein
MPLSAAEKQRHYRACRDAKSERRAAYLEKKKHTWESKKAAGKVKTINDISA